MAGIFKLISIKVLNIKTSKPVNNYSNQGNKCYTLFNKKVLYIHISVPMHR